MLILLKFWAIEKYSYAFFKKANYSTIPAKGYITHENRMLRITNFFFGHKENIREFCTQ